MRPTPRYETARTPKFLQRFKDAADGGTRMDEDAIRSAYRRWAPVYDHTFGRVAAEGRKHSVEIINQGRGPVFDVERVLVCEELELVEKRGLRPWGLFTMMRFHKANEARAAA